MPTLTRKRVAELKPDPGQPRKHFDEAELRQLGESLKARQLEPLQIKADGTLIDGERRYRAALLVGIPELDVIVTETPLSPTELSVWRLTSFFHKVDLSSPEKTDAAAALLKLNNWTNTELAKHLHVDASHLTRLLAPLKCIPGVQEAYRSGKLNLSETYEMFKLPAEEQAKLLAAGVKGRDKISAQARSLRNGQVEGVKSIRIALTSGVVVAFSSSSGLGLETALAAAQDAGKEIKRGLSEGLSPKTLQKAAAERAKGAGHVEC